MQNFGGAIWIFVFKFAWADVGNLCIFNGCWVMERWFGWLSGRVVMGGLSCRSAFTCLLQQTAHRGYWIGGTNLPSRHTNCESLKRIAIWIYRLILILVDACWSRWQLYTITGM
jgi:hypothetical protein